jgi:hypothetical protein
MGDAHTPSRQVGHRERIPVALGILAAMISDPGGATLHRMAIRIVDATVEPGSYPTPLGISFVDPPQQVRRPDAVSRPALLIIAGLVAVAVAVAVAVVGQWCLRCGQPAVAAGEGDRSSPRTWVSSAALRITVSLGRFTAVAGVVAYIDQVERLEADRAVTQAHARGAGGHRVMPTSFRPLAVSSPAASPSAPVTVSGASWPRGTVALIRAMCFPALTARRRR